MNSRSAIEADDIRRRYVDEHWTTAQLAAHYHCAETTITRRLEELGIARRPRGPYVDRERSFVWSPELAYAVGLITTDGNLSKDGRHLSIVSKDIDLLETIQECLGLENAITAHSGSWGTRLYRLQWSNRNFYDWLVDIGLMPAKSLRLGALLVPDDVLADFVCGCIDGDGTIVTYTDRYNTFKNEAYVYERLFVSLVSASRPFLDWVRDSVTRVAGVTGALFLHKAPTFNRSSIWALKYAKHDSVYLLNWLYYAPTLPCLARKRAKALPFLNWK